MVPPASKKKRALWERPQMPAWDCPKPSHTIASTPPWWLFQKGQVLAVLSRPKKQFNTTWVHVAFNDGECNGWILSAHAHACSRYRAMKNIPRAIVKKPRQARLSDLRPGVVLEYNHEMAIVVSWSTTALPTPKELALVCIEQTGGTKEVWLTQLHMP